MLISNHYWHSAINMITFRELVAIGIAITGITLTAFAMADGFQIYALFYFLCTICVLWLVLFGSLDPSFWQEYATAAALIGLVGLAGVFFYSNVTDLDLQSGYAGATTDMALLSITCNPITPEVLQVADHGIMACASEHLNDLSQTTFEAAKGVHLGPSLSMVDGVTQLTGDAKINSCARAFKAALKLCPHSFMSVNGKERAALLRAAE